jgi:hypothetical protein
MTELPKDLKERYLKIFAEQKEHYDQLAEEAASDRNKYLWLGGISTVAAGIEYLAKLPLDAIIVTGVGAGGFAYMGYGVERVRRNAIRGSKRKQRNIYELHEGLEPSDGDDFTGAA